MLNKENIAWNKISGKQIYFKKILFFLFNLLSQKKWPIKQWFLSKDNIFASKIVPNFQRYQLMKIKRKYPKILFQIVNYYIWSIK